MSDAHGVNPPRCPDGQLAEWVEGNPVHSDGQCCPDFSCCRPELLADKATREAFVAASEKERIGFLMHFLSAALDDSNVYVAGQTDCEH